jgi:glycosyltransferase involved in cell wall biosynthesis
METISLIVPCYNEHETIEIFYNEAIKYFDDKHNFNIIYVNDGSRDDSLQIMKSLAKKDSRVKYVGFSRNFGKEAAMYAGLEAAKGLKSDAAIIMDVDLQDPPSLIPEFLAKHEEGYKLVYAKQRNRKGAKLFSKICSLGFYKVYAHLTGDKQMSNGARDYCLLDKKVIDAFLSIKDCRRFTKGIYHYVGFKTTVIEFDYATRVAGTTKWSFRKLLRYAFFGIDEFSRFYLTAPKFIGLTWFIVLVYDIVRQTLNAVNAKAYSEFNWTPIRIDLVVISVCFIAFYLMKLVYDVRDQARNRPVYICEESNIETE